jgi:hypothetical protein
VRGLVGACCANTWHLSAVKGRTASVSMGRVICPRSDRRGIPVVATSASKTSTNVTDCSWQLCAAPPTPALRLGRRE